MREQLKSVHDSHCLWYTVSIILKEASMKKGILTSLLLLGIIFGAGNLIFPPSLGVLSGQDFIPAILGFIISDVGIAISAIVLCGFTMGGYSREFDQKISPKFSLILLIILYLILGPIFAVPRTAAVSYEMGISSLFSNDKIGLLFYSGVYFIFAYLLVIYPNGVINGIGKVLTPIFGSLILILVIMGALTYGLDPSHTTSLAYQDGKAFGTGFMEGYNTLDAVGVIPFSIVAVTTLKHFNFKSKKEYKQTMMTVGIMVTLIMSLFYIGLALLGNKFPIPESVLSDPSTNLGVYVLSQSVQVFFGDYAIIFLSLMVAITCFTTATGLLAAIADYFSQKFPQFSYRTYAGIFTFISFAISNLGLTQIIVIAVPILRILAPITITLVWFVFINKFTALSKPGMQLTLVLIGLITFISVMGPTFKWTQLMRIIGLLPLANQGIEWIIVGGFMTLLSLFLPHRIHGERFDFEKWQEG